MADSIDDQARSISDKLGHSVGIDPITILTIAQTLIPMLIKCFEMFHSTDPASSAPTASEKSAEIKAYLLDHYDQDSKTFDQHLIDQCRARTRKASRKNGQPKLSRSQLDVITAASLEHAMNADAATVCQCFVEAQSIPDDDQIGDSIDNGSS